MPGVTAALYRPNQKDPGHLTRRMMESMMSDVAVTRLAIQGLRSRLR